MNKNLELELVKKYPKILRDYNGDMMKTCMSWGMECGDGWYKLLDECMEKLQYFCDICSSHGNEVQVVASQIKEKYGTLRFYSFLNGGNGIESDIIDDIISETQNRSKHTCEETGEYGVLCHTGGWYKTLCYQKAREMGYSACSEDTEKYWKQKDEITNN